MYDVSPAVFFFGEVIRVRLYSGNGLVWKGRPKRSTKTYAVTTLSIPSFLRRRIMMFENFLEPSFKVGQSLAVKEKKRRLWEGSSQAPIRGMNRRN